MGLLIAEATISGLHTPHVARLAEDGWIVSWLPDRQLDRNQAITGMQIAEIVGTYGDEVTGHWWPAIESWASELGLTGVNAVARVRTCPAPKATP